MKKNIIKPLVILTAPKAENAYQQWKTNREEKQISVLQFFPENRKTEILILI